MIELLTKCDNCGNYISGLSEIYCASCFKAYGIRHLADVDGSTGASFLEALKALGTRMDESPLYKGRIFKFYIKELDRKE